MIALAESVNRLDCPFGNWPEPPKPDREQAYRRGFVQSARGIEAQARAMTDARDFFYWLRRACRASSLARHRLRTSSDNPDPVKLAKLRGTDQARQLFYVLIQYERDLLTIDLRQTATAWLRNVEIWKDSDMTKRIEPPRPEAIQRMGNLERLAQGQARQDAPARDYRPDPVLIRASDLKPERISWLWRNHFAAGKLNLICGDPGNGKSLITLDIASRITTGADWPDNEPGGKPGDVILIGCEDGASDTVIPRLIAAGADLSRVAILDGATTHDGKPASVNLDDLAPIEKALQQARDCRLIVIDPLSAFWGQADSYKNSDVRAALQPLAKLAERSGAAVLMVEHLSKSSRRAVYASQGSIGIIGAARAGWLVGHDEDDKRSKFLLPTKMNLAKDLSGWAYAIDSKSMAIDGETDDVPFIVWGEQTSKTADSLTMGDDRPGESHKPERDSAANWLIEALRDGPLPAKTVQQQARVNAISVGTLRRAATEIGVLKSKQSDGSWLWTLPGASLRPSG